MKALNIRFLDKANIIWTVPIGLLIAKEGKLRRLDGLSFVQQDIPTYVFRIIQSKLANRKLGGRVVSFPEAGSGVFDVEAAYADENNLPATTCEEVKAQREKLAALKSSAPSSILKPVIDDIKLFGMVDRTLSEMKYIVDHPGDFDSATFQTMKHHLEDMDLFVKHATGKLTKLGLIKSLPPVAEQKERGY